MGDLGIFLRHVFEICSNLSLPPFPQKTRVCPAELVSESLEFIYLNRCKKENNSAKMNVAAT